jgi:hypothetical protein
VSVEGVAWRRRVRPPLPGRRGRGGDVMGPWGCAFHYWHAGPTRQITTGPPVPVRLPGKYPADARGRPTRQITTGPPVPVRLPGKYPADARGRPTRQITTGPPVPVRLPGKYPADARGRPTRQMCSVHRGTSVEHWAYGGPTREPVIGSHCTLG